MSEITTFGTLKSELLALLGRAPADPVYQMVTADINRDLRLRDMEATATLTTGASYATPAAMLAVIDAYIAGDPRKRLTASTANTFNRTYDAGGTTPTEYALVDGFMLFNTANTADVLLRYYTQAVALSADEDDNVVLLKYPGIYWYGSLYHHARSIRDQAAAAAWLQDYTREIGSARADSARSRLAGPGPVIRPRVVA